MENLNSIISQNLKRIREDKKLSLDKVAKETGVSKSMLGQIERGESNPTITTVWKIANGLKVSFTSLLSHPMSDTEIVSENSIEPMIECDGKYKLYPYFPFEEGRNFELYKVVIEPGGFLDAEPHGTNTYEYITIYSGELTVMVEGQAFEVGLGDSIRFKADKAHGYKNQGEKQVTFNLTIHYPERM